MAAPAAQMCGAARPSSRSRCDRRRLAKRRTWRRRTGPDRMRARGGQTPCRGRAASRASGARERLTWSAAGARVACRTVPVPHRAGGWKGGRWPARSQRRAREMTEGTPWRTKHKLLCVRGVYQEGAPADQGGGDRGAALLPFGAWWPRGRRSWQHFRQGRYGSL